MTDFSGQKFADTTIELNGSRFTNCAFERCHLRYVGDSDFAFSGCTFVDVTWLWEGAALNTFAMLSALYNRAGPEGRRVAENVIDKIRAGWL